MSSKKSSILISILRDLLDKKSVTSIDTRASNTNQYFKTIKDNGIELHEEWKPNPNNAGRHKKRKLNIDSSNIIRAKKYLEHLTHAKNSTMS